MHYVSRKRLATVLVVGLTTSAARAQSWPAVFDPLVLQDLHLAMAPQDWETVQQDETFSIYVPATFWTDGQSGLPVAVRRKSSTPLSNGTSFQKVSLKIDINYYVGGQKWRDLTKLSLENGAEIDVISEGFAWNCHRFASGPAGYGYPSGFASWVRLHINGVNTGIYTSVEQRDKQMFRNRGIYDPDAMWLYKMGDVSRQSLEFGIGDSPTVQTLCYSPFALDPTCPTPDTATLAAELPQYVNMRGMLSLAAVDAFLGNPDGLFSHGKNCFFADFLDGPARMYLPWDLDAVLTQPNRTIYATQERYPAVILTNPTFRSQYTRIMNDLLCGPLSDENLVYFINQVEPVVSSALAEDPNNRLDGESVEEHFESIRDWISRRVANVRSQLEATYPCMQVWGDFDGDGDVDSDDLSVFTACRSGPDVPHNGTATCVLADFDQDGDVDHDDFGRIQRCFSGAGVPAELTCGG